MFSTSKHKQFKVVITLSLVVVVLCFFSFSRSGFNAKEVGVYYKTNLDSLLLSVQQFQSEATTASPEHMALLFRNARRHYKKIEFLVAYHYPASAQRLNGPALPDSKPSEPKEPRHPTGFQVLEEKIFMDETPDKAAILYELSNIENRVKRLQLWFPALELSASNVLDAMRLNMYTVITLGISGFDSPIANYSIEEAKVSLQAASAVLKMYEGSEKVEAALTDAVAFINSTEPDFNSFDRATFIRRYINAVTQALHVFQVQNKIPFPEQHGAVAANVGSLFHPKAFDPLYYAPSGTQPSTDAQVALGKAFFQENLLSANGKRSCRTCHEPAKFFSDGLKVNDALLANKKLLRNTTSLVNSALQPVQFYDSRIAFLEDQVHDVIVSKNEMGGRFDKIIADINSHKKYQPLVKAAYSTTTVTKDIVKKSLAAYVRSLVYMDTNFDKYMRGNATAMTKQQLHGFNLFMGKAKCGTCHFAPLFSGVVPPLYDRMDSEVLGVPSNTDTLHPVADLDSGKYHLYSIPHHLFSFKTPTVRNVANTAPYMHNGVYNTLEEVIDFYDRGGGNGIGLNIPHQTLPSTRLNLSPAEKQAIASFLHALSNK